MGRRDLLQRPLHGQPNGRRQAKLVNQSRADPAQADSCRLAMDGGGQSLTLAGC